MRVGGSLSAARPSIGIDSKAISTRRNLYTANVGFDRRV
jgi:hypothetical protein